MAVLSTSAWAHQQRKRWREALAFPCICGAKPGQRCVTYEIMRTGERTRVHASRWAKLRKEDEQR